MDDGSFLRKLQSKKMQPSTLVLDNVCPATRLLEKRRQMFEVQEALEAQKHEFSCKEEIFKRREESLQRKDLQLQESLIRFSKFLQENDAKRARAEKKASDEIRAQNIKTKEIKNLQKNMESLILERNASSETLEKSSKYHRYLEQVIESTDEYQEIPELIQRYETLQSTHQDLLQQEKEIEHELHAVKEQLHFYTHDKADEIVVLNNRLAQLKREIDMHDAEAALHQSKRDGTIAATSHKTLEYGQLIMATHNLFQRCCQNSVIAHPASMTPLEQLDVIGHFVADLEAAIHAHAAPTVSS